MTPKVLRVGSTGRLLDCNSSGAAVSEVGLRVCDAMTRTAFAVATTIGLLSATSLLARDELRQSFRQNVVVRPALLGILNFLLRFGVAR